MAASTMVAYNASMEHACDSDLLLPEKLGGEWQFGGFVTSRCWALKRYQIDGRHNFATDGSCAGAAMRPEQTQLRVGVRAQLSAGAPRQAGPETEIDTEVMKRCVQARFRIRAVRSAAGCSLLRHNNDE